MVSSILSNTNFQRYIWPIRKKKNYQSGSEWIRKSWQSMCTPLLRAPGLEPHHQMQFSFISEHLFVREGGGVSHTLEWMQSAYSKPHWQDSRYLSFVPPTGRAWHKAFFRWVGGNAGVQTPAGISRKRDALGDKPSPSKESHASRSFDESEWSIKLLW